MEATDLFGEYGYGVGGGSKLAQFFLWTQARTSGAPQIARRTEGFGSGNRLFFICNPGFQRHATKRKCYGTEERPLQT